MLRQDYEVLISEMIFSKKKINEMIFLLEGRRGVKNFGKPYAQKHHTFTLV